MDGWDDTIRELIDQGYDINDFMTFLETYYPLSYDQWQEAYPGGIGGLQVRFEEVNSESGKFRNIPEQQEHIRQMTTDLRERGSHIDASGTGSGKTYKACMVAKQLNASVIVFCQKNVFKSWFDHCMSLGVKLLGISNYEIMINGKWYDLHENPDYTILQKPKNATYIPYLTFDEEGLAQWNFANMMETNFLVIFDEAQSIRNPSNRRFDIAAGLRDYFLVSNELRNNQDIMSELQYPYVYTLYLTATPVESTKGTDWASFFYLCGYIDQPTTKALRKLLGNTSAEDVHNFIYQSAMLSKIYIDIPGYTDDIKVIKHPLSYEDAERINAAYGLTELERSNLPKIAEMTKDMKVVEMMKCRIFAEYAKEAINAGNYVIVFLNYVSSVYRLTNYLLEDFTIDDIAYIFRGDKKNIPNNDIIKNDKRTYDEETRRFNSGEAKIIICTYAAGSTGISLHDTQGGRPRYTILSPTVSYRILKQALGRAYRVGLKSNVKQRIIFTSNSNYSSLEDRLAQLMNDKIQYISMSVDGEESTLNLQNSDDRANDDPEL